MVNKGKPSNTAQNKQWQVSNKAKEAADFVQVDSSEHKHFTGSITPDKLF